MTVREPSPSAPAVGVVAVRDRNTTQAAGRLDAELRGRIAVGTQLLIVDVGQATSLDPEVLGVLADAAKFLQDDRAGSVVLRNATGLLLRQMRLMRIDHIFELEL